MSNIKHSAINTMLFCLILTAGLLISVNASASNEAPVTQQASKVLLLAQGGGSCVSKCEAAKKRCMAQHMTTNSYGVKMVTPDGAKRCWAAFHQCKSYC